MKKIIERKNYSIPASGIISGKNIPKKYRTDVLKLQTFFNILSGYANSSEPGSGSENFKNFVRKWQNIKKENSFGYYVRSDDSMNEVALGNIAYLVHRYELPTKEVDNYLRSIAIDMRKKSLHSSQDLLRYLQYSGEAPAVLLAKVLEFPNAVSHHAKMLGRSTKLLYLVKSIHVDNTAGKCYFPAQELKKFGLVSLDKDFVTNNKEAYEQFVALQIKRYKAWQEEAKKGDTFLPRKVRLLVKRTRSRNNLIADAIVREPILIFDDNLRIAKIRIIHDFIVSVARR